MAQIHVCDECGKQSDGVGPEWARVIAGNGKRALVCDGCLKSALPKIAELVTSVATVEPTAKA